MLETRPTVFILDADPTARDRLAQLVHSAGWRPQTFCSAGEFMTYPNATGPACLVMETRLPDRSGLEVQAEVMREQSQVSVIFTTDRRADVPTAVRAMKAGALEFLTKPLDEELVLEAVQIGLEVSRAALRDQAVQESLQDRYDTLSAREREVMGLIVSGLLNKQVGGRLGISEITVKAHRGRVMDKMHARSFAELVRMSACLEAAWERKRVQAASLPERERLSA